MSEPPSAEVLKLWVAVQDLDSRLRLLNSSKRDAPPAFDRVIALCFWLDLGISGFIGLLNALTPRERSQFTASHGFTDEELMDVCEYLNQCMEARLSAVKEYYSQFEQQS